MTEPGEHERGRSPEQAASHWDRSSHEQFFQYYASASQSQATLERFTSIRNTILRIINRGPLASRILEVVDIGCGAGTQCMLWAELGHHAHGLDVNEPLLQLARDRAGRSGYLVDFRIGPATQLPWRSESMDVCLMVELLEHVPEWKACISECIRIVKPGGILFLTTSNKLCPVQYEFNLPLYSWYPATLKRHFEWLARTSKPELANFAKYPAVNWFSFYQLRSFLASQGMWCLDRFDLLDLERKSFPSRFLVQSIRRVPFLRWLAHVGTPGTIMLALREKKLRE